MFGVMQHLDVIVCKDALDAIAKGYSKEDAYNTARPVEIKKVVIVQDGTEDNNSTVDLFLEDEDGREFLVMITGNLLKSLPV